LWYAKRLDGSSANSPERPPGAPNNDRAVEADEAKANLVSSLLPNGKHAPALDIDLPCRLQPSKTPGHYHLYIDTELDWGTYQLLLAALAAAGIVEWGYYHASVNRGQTFLRRPGVDGVPPDREELHRTTQDALRRTLVSYYRANAQACAWLCDMELDPSGKLLGEVRQWAGTDPAPGEWRS